MREVFIPSHTVPADLPDLRFDEPVLQARFDMNREDPGRLITNLRDQVYKIDKTATALLAGPEPGNYSSTEGIIFYDSFGMGVDSARLTRPEYLRRVLEHADVRDGDGRYLPVSWIASPGFKSSYNLSNSQKKEIRKEGNFGHIAAAGLRVAELLKWQRVHLFGVSMGGDIALAGAGRQFSKNFDIGTVFDCDPTNSQQRRPYIQLARDFTADSDLAPARAASGIRAQQAEIKPIRGNIQFDYSVLRPISARTLAQGMAHDRFQEDAHRVLTEGRAHRLVVAYSANGHIVKPAIIEPQLAALSQVDKMNRLTSVRIEGGDHTWMDNYPLLGQVALLGFSP